jgi:uncharacterized repeat protein (TIGR02543 family)
MNRKFFSFLVISALVAVIFTSCDEEENNPKEFTVSFNSNEGSAVSSQTVKEGEKVTKPAPDPIRNGYEFAAWYKEAGLMSEWQFDTDVVTADITLHAKWDEDDPTLTPAEEQKKAVLAALGENSGLNEFAEALEALDFSDVDADELTIFAVQNSGMSKSALKSTDGFDIKRHVVAGKYSKSLLINGTELTSLDGSTLTIKIEGDKIYINGVELGHRK